MHTENTGNKLNYLEILQYSSDFQNYRTSNIKTNKTSIQWTPGSQVYLSKKKKRFGQK